MGIHPYLTATFFTDYFFGNVYKGIRFRTVQNRDRTENQRYIVTSIPTRAATPDPPTVGVDGAKVFALSAAAPSCVDTSTRAV